MGATIVAKVGTSLQMKQVNNITEFDEEFILSNTPTLLVLKNQRDRNNLTPCSSTFNIASKLHGCLIEVRNLLYERWSGRQSRIMTVMSRDTA